MSIPGTKFTQSVVFYLPPQSNQSTSQSQFSDQQIYKMVDEAFNQFDANKTGELDSRELKNFLEYAVKIGLLEPSKKSLFIQYIYKMDTNRDGLVSKQELYEYFVKKASGKLTNQPQFILNSNSQKEVVKKQPFPDRKYTQQQIEQLAEVAFSKYDANSTGQLDYYQTKNYLKQQWNNQFNYHEIIKISDKNHNGTISKEQLIYFLKAKLL